MGTREPSTEPEVESEEEGYEETLLPPIKTPGALNHLKDHQIVALYRLATASRLTAANKVIHAMWHRVELKDVEAAMDAWTPGFVAPPADGADDAAEEDPADDIAP